MPVYLHQLIVIYDRTPFKTLIRKKYFLNYENSLFKLYNSMLCSFDSSECIFSIDLR